MVLILVVEISGAMMPRNGLCGPGLLQLQGQLECSVGSGVVKEPMFLFQKG